MITHRIELTDTYGNVYEFDVANGLVMQGIAFYGSIIDATIVKASITRI
jgi:hypothetical protein